MPRKAAIDLDQISRVFPDGVASRARLLELGLSSSSIAHRCRPGGPWQTAIPGVVLLHSGSPTRRQLGRVALVHAGPRAMLTGIEAARLYGVRRLPHGQLVHVLVPHERKVSSRVWVTVERTRRLPNPVNLRGLAVAPTARAIIDATHRMQDLDAIRAMVADVVQRGLCTPSALGIELAKGPAIGSAPPRRVLSEIGDGVRSAAEAWGRSLVRRSPLPEPGWNVPVRDRAGRLLGVVDGWWRVGLAWETDSKEFHLTPDGYARTLEKHAALTAAGVVVIHTVPSRLRTDPHGVLRELMAAHEVAKSCPAPQVMVPPSARIA
ncbi:hypothetical protein ORV05_03035 [Amycolatopsis cynarae]|uniref:Transcriptional regulator, AbiEi antitoxin, Type IV TA system n=1 Tax=Amycolatopsis cynarae TaxID=2995223 RepID=A0ABY7B6C7_9PSEU|nr:hypothetical protein [Amycolatopsis sp. HUAS 11-8]WAL66802.1 hypothetical protein ORV05_03035 [Amycolatopsis sp. HUAS 11-8]